MKENLNYKPHRVTWDSQKISRTWDFYSTLDDTYFSKEAGNSLLKMVNSKIPVHGKVLDFGCGTGHFIQILLNNKIYTAGYDKSEESLKAAEEKFASDPFFLGMFHSDSFPIPASDESYDLIFSIELIEHLLPEQIESTLTEMNRLTRKYGHLVLTTRNQEDLNQRKVICPDCGATFHRKQHISSFNQSSLENYMSNAGFSPVFCKPVLFSVSKLSWIKRLYITYRRISKENLPSLLYIGTKI